MRSVITLLAIMLGCALPAEAQYFGRNKVQYENFDFKILQTEHFDIYYYDSEASAARMAGRMAERWYTRLSRVLDYQMTSRQPLILYASSVHFRQTNAVSGTIGEGTGGVTESFKRRIVLPVGGTLADTDHVIGHELVHAFQFAMTGADSQGSSGNGMPSALRLPLWLIEGMAEYLSIGPVDAHTAMWLRDAAAREQLPTIDRLDDPDFFPYRYGQAFWAYVAGRFGDGIVRRIFLGAARNGIPETFKRVLATDAKTLSAEWHASILEDYGPVLAATTPAAQMPGPLISESGEGGELNLGPRLSPDGSRVIFLSERDLFSIDVYLADAATGEVIRKLVSTASDPHFDSLQFIGSAGGWHPEGRQFAFGAIRAGQPVLSIIDIDGDTVREIELSQLDEVFNPSWSPDGQQIAFSALKGGFTDLYLYDLRTDTLRRLTTDRYSDSEPAWSPDGRSLVFATDRFTTSLDRLSIGDLRLASIDVSSGAVRELAAGEDGKHISPQWSPDGRSIYFIGDASGISNVCRLDVASGRVERLTNVLSGVSGITARSPALSVASKSGRLAYTLFTDNQYWIMTSDAGALSAATEGPPPTINAAALPPMQREDSLVAALLEDDLTGLPPASAEFASTEYKPSLSLDYMGQPSIGVGYDAFGGYIGGGISAFFSDMLGNHQLGTTIQASGGLRDIGGQVVYLNRSNRWTLGGAVEYIPYRFGSFGQSLTVIDGQPVLVEQTLVERQTVSGVTGIAAYPLSRVMRVEFNAGVRHIGFSRELQTAVFSSVTGEFLGEETEDLPSGDGLTLGIGGAALVYDSSIFGATSPILGRRFRFDFTQSTGSLTYSSVVADFRQYFMPVRPFTLAFRGLHYGRYGGDSEDLRLQSTYLGFAELVRGYEYGSFEANECQPGPAGECQAFDNLVGSRLLVANAELRFPLWGAFGGDDFYGPLPVEMALFADAGVAWDRDTSPRFANGDREWVRSVGAALRINAFGYAIAEIDYVRPLDRPDRGWLWQFTLQPGF